MATKKKAADVALSPGVPTPFAATGLLELLGVTVPLSVNAQAELALDEDGSPLIFSGFSDTTSNETGQVPLTPCRSTDAVAV